jgi:pyruvate dehydrogenase (quinone)
MAGDGAMQMNGMNELITVARYWKRWADPRFVVVVLDNGDLNFVTWEQRVMEGNPKFAASQDLPRVSMCGFAEMLGLHAARVESPGDVGPALDAALAAGRPALVEVAVDPNVPMLPPHIKAEQARNYLRALLKGDPDAARIVRASIKEIFGKP